MTFSFEFSGKYPPYRMVTTTLPEAPTEAIPSERAPQQLTSSPSSGSAASTGGPGGLQGGREVGRYSNDHFAHVLLATPPTSLVPGGGRWPGDEPIPPTCRELSTCSGMATFLPKAMWVGRDSPPVRVLEGGLEGAGGRRMWQLIYWLKQP